MTPDVADWPALAIMAAFAAALLKIVQSVLAYYQSRLGKALDQIVSILETLEERTRRCLDER